MKSCHYNKNNLNCISAAVIRNEVSLLQFTLPVIYKNYVNLQKTLIFINPIGYNIT